MKSSKTAALQNEIAIAIHTKSEHNKTNRPSKGAVQASLEGRLLDRLFCNSLFLLSLICQTGQIFLVQHGPRYIGYHTVGSGGDLVGQISCHRKLAAQRVIRHA